MNRIILLITIRVLVSVNVIAQGPTPDISIDTAGRSTSAYTISSASGGGGASLKIGIDFPKGKRDAIAATLLDKVRQTRENLQDQDGSFYKFYSFLWTGPVVDHVVTELTQLEDYLKLPSAGDAAAYRYLADTKAYLNGIFSEQVADMYFLNKRPFASPFALTAADYSKEDHAYKLDVYFEDPLKKFLSGLFNYSYGQDDMVEFRHAGGYGFNIKFRNALGDLVRRGRDLGDKPDSTLEDVDLHVFNQYHNDVATDDFVNIVQNASYFKTWIWWRKGELTINPLEIAQKDTAQSTLSSKDIKASRNVSLVKDISQTRGRLNALKIAVQGKDDRILQFSAQDVDLHADNAAQLKSPLDPDENVSVVVHNIASGETLGLRETKTLSISSGNIIDTVANTIYGLAQVLTPALGNWAKIATLFNPVPVEHAGPGYGVMKFIAGKSRSTEAAFLKAKSAKDLQSAVADDLRREHSYNDFYFRQALGQAFYNDNDINRFIKRKNRAELEQYVNGILTYYHAMYDAIVEARKQFQTDSLVASNLYAILQQSNYPPARIVTEYDELPFFRTEIKKTGKTDDNVDRFFQVSKYVKKDGKVVDSSVIGNFDYKAGRRYIILASAGPGYSFAKQYYGETTVSSAANGTLQASTKQSTVRLVAGIHFYPWKIYPMDNSLFPTGRHPWYTRLSIFAGVGIPDPLKYYYPGLGYDIIPGLKLIGGANFYRYSRYQTENNVVTKQTSAISLEGPFVALNLDPNVLLKALGITK